jgi:SCP-2 sterol transfer family protein
VGAIPRGYVAGSEQSVSPRNLPIVPEFLSDEWIAALADAARAAGRSPEAHETRLVVQPVVLGVPERGEVRYQVSFGETSCGVVGPGADAPAADVRLETDYVTAVALARGETNAQAALAAGRLRVSGDVAKLAAASGALGRLGDLFAAVRAVTTYPSASRTDA